MLANCLSVALISAETRASAPIPAELRVRQNFTVAVPGCGNGPFMFNVRVKSGPPTGKGAAHFDATVLDRRAQEEFRLPGLRLPMPGEHNVLNSLAAITVARELGVGDHRIRTALSAFEGVKRRFSRVGEWNGAAIIDDYAHNPFKIAAALKAARQAYSGPIIAIVQPHRYTRLRDTFEQFCTCLNDADIAIIAPVYPAGEQPIEGITHLAYAEAIRAHGHRNVLTTESAEELPGMIAPLAKPGSVIVFLGAGSITNWAGGLESVLKAREGRT